MGKGHKMEILMVGLVAVESLKVKVESVEGGVVKISIVWDRLIGA